MKKMFAKWLTFALALLLAFSLVACGNKTDAEKKEEDPPAPPPTFSLDFNTQLKDTSKSWTAESATNPVTNHTVNYKSIMNVTYVSTPMTAAHATIQSLNIYVPASYLNDDGTVNTDGTQGEYTAETAPIIYINNVSGYSGGKPYEINTTMRLAGKNGWYYNFLERGYVVIFVGERGITTSYVSDGTAYYMRGEPYSLVDLKAGIRFIRKNNSQIPGDAEKIISSGVSAGGNMSALLGVTGNSDEFDDLLEEVGAVMDEKDDVFASQDYCPITDLDHAALAYEWFWTDDEGSADAYVPISEFEGAASAIMARKYAEYINTLGLKDGDTTLTLDATGAHSGTFFDWMIEQFEASYDAYVAVNGDTDSSKYEWLSYENGKTTISGTEANQDILKAMMADGYNVRQKGVFSFDDPVYSSTSDSGVFGAYHASASASDKMRHFTIGIAETLKELEAQYPTEYGKYYNAYYTEANLDEVKRMINLYSPFYWINLGETDIPDNFRICVGTQDRDTATCVSGTLALKLRNAGYNANYELIWNQIHTDADVVNGFENWVDSLCLNQD